jgi:hypothetical protein
MLISKTIYFYKSKLGNGRWFKCKDEEDCLQMVALGFEVKKIIVDKTVPFTDPDFELAKDLPGWWRNC